MLLRMDACDALLRDCSLLPRPPPLSCNLTLRAKKALKRANSSGPIIAAFNEIRTSTCKITLRRDLTEIIRHVNPDPRHDI